MSSFPVFTAGKTGDGIVFLTLTRLNGSTQRTVLGEKKRERCQWLPLIEITVETVVESAAARAARKFFFLFRFVCCCFF